MKLVITVILTFNTLIVLSQDTIVQLDTFSAITWNQFVQKRYDILRPLYHIDANQLIPRIEITNDHIHYLIYYHTMDRGNHGSINIKIDSSNLTSKEKSSVYNNLDTLKTYFYQYTTDFQPEWDSIITGSYIGSNGGWLLFIRIDYGKVRYIFNSRGAHSYVPFDDLKYVINNNYIIEDFELTSKLWKDYEEKRKSENNNKVCKWRKRKSSN